MTSQCNRVFIINYYPSQHNTEQKGKPVKFAVCCLDHFTFIFLLPYSLSYQGGYLSGHRELQAVREWALELDSLAKSTTWSGRDKGVGWSKQKGRYHQGKYNMQMISIHKLQYRFALGIRDPDKVTEVSQRDSGVQGRQREKGTWLEDSCQW